MVFMAFQLSEMLYSQHKLIFTANCLRIVKSALGYSILIAQISYRSAWCCRLTFPESIRDTAGECHRRLRYLFAGRHRLLVRNHVLYSVAYFISYTFIYRRLLVNRGDAVFRSSHFNFGRIVQDKDDAPIPEASLILQMPSVQHR